MKIMNYCCQEEICVMLREAISKAVPSLPPAEFEYFEKWANSVLLEYENNDIEIHCKNKEWDNCKAKILINGKYKKATIKYII